MGRQDPAARRVSNLTDSQVERKRAIDRANQQHCQRRKKARMQWLEQEVPHSPTSTTSMSSLSSMPTIAVPVAHRSGLPGVLPDDDVDASHSDSIWTVNLREILDPNHHDSELGNIAFEFPMPPPHDDVTLSPPMLANVDGAGDGSTMAFAHSLAPPTTPAWQTVPLHLAPANDLDRFIFDTTNSGRRLQQQSGGAGELTQAEFPSISSLLNPNLGDDGSKPLTFALATHVVAKSNVRSVTTRIALMYTLSHLLRWLVCRNKSSYDKLPEFLKPTHLQRTVPHPPWVDIITWPQARDAIIRSKSWLTEDFEFDEFRVKTGADMSVNWPYTDSGAFLDLGDGQNLVLSPIFENHIRRVENWTLGKKTATDYPFMRFFCKDLVEEGLQ
ncbi:hypothetical protein SPBR_07390 [Sporothrix brasiliensis 5110]|uniref:BZIP domain-containing protein n=1 Tax=Sporothrix brasiliensis 5110 TaxID=1398154 RepID=A0A0C2IXK7_9PEZI|nr:uncharacterized protein SPBR_07390 [Sporothrix brasiliensis 5110]KIH89752.1 hypothetical protein SPBR_07390 [Sporothrix brasiliensis 5110]